MIKRDWMGYILGFLSIVTAALSLSQEEPGREYLLIATGILATIAFIIIYMEDTRQEVSEMNEEFEEFREKFALTERITKLKFQLAELSQKTTKK